MGKENLICGKLFCIHPAKTHTTKESAAWRGEAGGGEIKNSNSRVLETSWTHPDFLSVSFILGIAYAPQVTHPEVIAHLQLRTKQLGEEFLGHRRNQDE